MNHLAMLDHADAANIQGKDLRRRATGRFYTPALVGQHLVRTIASRPGAGARESLSVIDPFGGDGRLVAWSIAELATRGIRHVSAHVWEQDAGAASAAEERIAAVGRSAQVDVDVHVWTGDTFERTARSRERFDVVITNPPWEALKPDHRELRSLSTERRDGYVAKLKAFDRRLASEYPISQPSRRFAGWGTNLSRVGTEVALRLTAADGVCGVVCPSSLLADHTSAALRRWMLSEFALEDIAHWPAEARLFDQMDVPCLTLVLARGAAAGRTRLTRISPTRQVHDSAVIPLTREWLEQRDYAIPVELGAAGVRLLETLDHHPPLVTLEGRGTDGLWAGRELDETGRKTWTVARGARPFVRSAHVGRLSRPRLPSDEFVDLTQKAIPASADRIRLVWRDIARPSQRRRLHATLLPAGPVTGNSVNVAYFRDDDVPRLQALLGIVSSLPFEFQIRSRLMTNHVSLSVMRFARIPRLTEENVGAIAAATVACFEGQPDGEALLERTVADAYGLDHGIWAEIADHFTLSEQERRAFELAW